MGDLISVMPKLHTNGDVSVRSHRHHDLVEVAVADDDLAQAATVKLAALSSDREQRGIDQELLVEVRALVRRAF